MLRNGYAIISGINNTYPYHNKNRNEHVLRPHNTREQQHGVSGILHHTNMEFRCPSLWNKNVD